MTDRPCKTAILVDDQPYARDDLRQLLQAHPEVAVVAEAQDLASARRAMAARKPDIVFLDVQLGRENGFDLLPSLSPQTAVIFVTAHDRYAVRAFEVNALDYLVKPVSAERLCASLARLDTGASRAMPPEKLEPGDSIFVQHARGQSFVKLSELAVVSVLGGNYCTLELIDGAHLVIRSALADWDRALPHPFSRVSRSALANLSLAVRLERGAHGAWHLQLTGRPEPLAVSRRRLSAVRGLMTALASPLPA